jgi:hypothetical protein
MTIVNKINVCQRSTESISLSMEPACYLDRLYTFYILPTDYIRV